MRNSRQRPGRRGSEFPALTFRVTSAEVMEGLKGSGSRYLNLSVLILFGALGFTVGYVPALYEYQEVPEVLVEFR